MDCTVRALALAAELDYDIAWLLLAESGRKLGKSHPMFLGLLEAARQGYIQYRRVDDCGQTLKQFTAAHPSGRFILRISGTPRINHAIAVIDGVVHDKAPSHGRKQVKSTWQIIPLTFNPKDAILRP